MEYQNNNNKNSNEKSTNTNGIQFMNSQNPLAKSTLIIKWWNQFMAIQISPALDEKDRRDGKMFDYQTQLSTALSPEKLMVLNHIINSSVKPALENNEEVNKGIPVASGLICVGTKKINYEEVGERVTPFVAIYKGINESTRKAESGLIYFFNIENNVVSNYDMNTGNADVEFVYNTEFELFSSLLPDGAKVLCGGTAHIGRYHDRYYSARLSKNIEVIGNSLGAPIETSNSYKRYTGKSSDIFSRNSSTPVPPSENGEMTSIDGLDDIPF
jgi:hypothetical protein